MEALHIRDKTLILDGAHNPQKLNALSSSISHAYPDQKVACLVSFVRSRETRVHDNLKSLLPTMAYLIITTFHTDDSDHFPTDISLIEEKIKALGYKAYETVNDPEQALAKLLERPEPVLLITGSFFLLQQLRPSIVKSK